MNCHTVRIIQNSHKFVVEIRKTMQAVIGDLLNYTQTESEAESMLRNDRILKSIADIVLIYSRTEFCRICRHRSTSRVFLFMGH